MHGRVRVRNGAYVGPNSRSGILLAAGLLALAGAWLGPLPALARHLFAAHMTVHLAVVAVGAPLIALAVAGTRFDPVRYAPAFFAAIPASLAEFVIVWVWHAPALHHAARHDAATFVAEQGAFLLAGLWLWLSAFGGAPRARAARAATGVIALLLTSMHMTLLGALIALSPRPLYSVGDSALQDQHVGGAIMLLVGGAVYLAGGLSLMVNLVRTFTPATGPRR
jgi:putative membrane protein